MLMLRFCQAFHRIFCLFSESPLLCVKIQKIFRRFLWKKEEGDKGCHLVSWDKVITSHSLGGLGMENIRTKKFFPL